MGLGNPGVEYMGTRHSTGAMLVDKLSEKLQSDYGWRRKKEMMVFETPKMTLIKSAEVFMNESGRMVTYADNLYVAHDDLDIKLGEYKIQFGKGPKNHGGINSIEQRLRTSEFWRIRIGIENRVLPTAGEVYVLQRFTSEEKNILDEVIERIIDEILKATN